MSFQNVVEQKMQKSSWIAEAERIAPMLRDTARDAEVARQPLDHVIEKIRESGLYALMVPEKFGGHEQDLDTFFEVVLRLSRADASMGWSTGFYIEHNLWLLHFEEAVCEEVFAGENHVLAPAALNIGGGSAERVEGGYQLSGRWQWGTGIVHGSWVLAGGMATDESGTPIPMFFLMPVKDVTPIDTWFVNGMCATGSWDFEIDQVFIPENRAVPFLDMLEATTGISERFPSPLYQTPLMPVLAFAAGLPILGAAQNILHEFTQQTQKKIEANALRAGMPLQDMSGVIGEAALKLEAAELTFRDVLAEVMAKRKNSTAEERSHWLSRLAFAVYSCKEAALRIGEETGASGGYLDNPIQRAIRDISIACNHVVFSKQSRYGDVGKALLGKDWSESRTTG